MKPPSPESMQTSGFYGSGASAAWAITMFASWIPLVQGDYTHNLHFIVYALYTNWAAIDLLRHSIRAPSFKHRDLSDSDRAWLDNMVASVTVIQMGIIQVVAQLLVCNYRSQNGSIAHVQRALDARRRLILTVGAILPVSIASFASIQFFSLAYSWPPSVISGILGFWTVVYNMYLLLRPRCLEWEGLQKEPLLCAYFTLVCYFLISFIALFADIQERGWSLFSVAGYVLPNQCYVFPCAPQGIGEWDQAFSLLIALTCFLYEFGYGIIRIARKAFHGVCTVWQ
jgi:hypothetical protein